MSAKYFRVFEQKARWFDHVMCEEMLTSARVDGNAVDKQTFTEKEGVKCWVWVFVGAEVGIFVGCSPQWPMGGGVFS